eukprot:TRINITY_DN7968_c0_g1_i1.p1 TRINITY_DN7968_c0_g1~~TRINITY_DN7968_c0_g1_i1.p1  ORF type:complete len:333 (-),score=40.34 TRINITY_DN7968_c0_g1_i1:127-1125(-)
MSSAPPKPDTVCHVDNVVRSLYDMYTDLSSYDAALTQTDHALQAACQAVQHGYGPYTIVAALLHDIGWKLAGDAPQIDDLPPDVLRREHPEWAAVLDRRDASGCSADNDDAPPTSVAERLGILSHCGAVGASGAQQRAQHDVIGATWLRMHGFHERVAHLVEGHVLAKRYLCGQDPQYLAALSPSSRATLRFQGGPMTAPEADAFARGPLFELCCAMRRWDEHAKHPGLPVPPLGMYLPLVRAAMVAPPSPVDSVRTSFRRDGNVILGVDPAACGEGGLEDDGWYAIGAAGRAAVEALRAAVAKVSFPETATPTTPPLGTGHTTPCPVTTDV